MKLTARSYIPMKVDYSDMCALFLIHSSRLTRDGSYDILAFLVGTPDGQNGHDEVGQKIAEAGRLWALHHVRLLVYHGRRDAEVAHSGEERTWRRIVRVDRSFSPRLR